MSVYRGLALVLSKATPIGNFPKDNLLFDLGSGNLLGVPTSVLVMLVVGLVGHVVLGHTAFGWHTRIESTPGRSKCSLRVRCCAC